MTLEHSYCSTHCCSSFSVSTCSGVWHLHLPPSSVSSLLDWHLPLSRLTSLVMSELTEIDQAWLVGYHQCLTRLLSPCKKTITAMLKVHYHITFTTQIIKKKTIYNIISHCKPFRKNSVNYFEKIHFIQNTVNSKTKIFKQMNSYSSCLSIILKVTWPLIKTEKRKISLITITELFQNYC